MKEQETAISSLLESRVTEKLRTERTKQAICDNSMELRELEKKLGEAHANQQQMLQIKEKAAEFQRQKLHVLEEAEQLRLLQLQTRQLEQQHLHDVSIKSEAYRRALHGQLEELEGRKIEEMAQFLREKAMVDEVVRKIVVQDEK